MLLRNKGLTLVEVMIVCALLVILFGTAFHAFFSLIRGGTFSENLLEVNYHTQQAILNITVDVKASSDNPDGIYRPRIEGGELRFKIVTGFDITSGTAVYSDYWVCYYYDETNQQIIRRFRNNAGQLLTAAPPEFPGEAEQVIASYITSVNWAVDPDTCAVSVSVTSAKGDAEDNTRAEVTKTAIVRPENTD